MVESFIRGDESMFLTTAEMGNGKELEDIPAPSHTDAVQ
jgi:hypothetical protein